MHVMSCYAPSGTKAASCEENDNFLNQRNAFIFQQKSITLSLVILMSVLVLGLYEMDDDGEWSGVSGPHRYGAINDAGKELLSFLS